MDFGGPLPDVVYRCFEWESCEIEALDGTSLSHSAEPRGSKKRVDLWALLFRSTRGLLVMINDGGWLMNDDG